MKFTPLFFAIMMSAGVAHAQYDNVETTPSTPPQATQKTYYEYQPVAGQQGQQTGQAQQGQPVQIPEDSIVSKQTNVVHEENTVTQPHQYGASTPVEELWNKTPAQITNIKRHYERQVRALEQDANPAQCVSRSIVLSTEPGQTAPVIRLDGRNISTVLITDITGTPWPIDQLGSMESEVQTRYTEGAGDFSISPRYNNAQGNIVVNLVKNPVPLVFSYVTNQRQVDCLLTVRLDKASGLGSNPELTSIGTGAMDTSLNSTLFGVAPKDSKTLRSSDSNVQAWQTQDRRVIIRTKYKLMSPGFTETLSSPDGMNVYRTTYSPNYRYLYNGSTGSFTLTR